VFLLLDMHQSIAQLATLFKSLLSDPEAAPGARSLLADLAQLLSTVATSAASLFSDYEDSVAQDASKVLPMDGTIHPLTAQVVSYMKVSGLGWAWGACGCLWRAGREGQEPRAGRGGSV
jgi:hypothetical protein